MDHEMRIVSLSQYMVKSMPNILITLLVLTCLIVLWTNHTFYMPRMGDCLA